MRKSVLITNQLPSLAYRLLSRKFNVTWNKKQLTEEQLIARVRPYHALLTTLADPITANVLEAAPRLKCVSNYAVGYNNIDIKTAQRLGIQVTNTPDVLTEATADIAWALLLSCARRVPEGEAMVRARQFKGWHPLMLLGLDLTCKTLGIYGFGRIGRAVAWRGRGWNMKVLYHQRKRAPVSVEKAYNARYVTFKAMLKRSDFLSVNAPLTPETRHRFTDREFKAMKPTSVFINTARGPIHDEKSLAKALRAGWIASAGLDVYEEEPRINKELLSLKNCTLLPHLGSATIDTRDRMAELAVTNIDLVLNGKNAKTPVALK